MATQPRMISSWTALPDCWELFKNSLARRVQECNIVSDGLLWLLFRPGTPLDSVRVESATRPGDRIDCSFDAELGTLTCVPGSAVHATVRKFQWTGTAFFCEGREFSVEDAASRVLDTLVCADDE